MLSVVIPTYNEARFLPGLLASLKTQQGISFEIIVADAYSTDDTPALARAENARVVVGGSPAAGRNAGAAAARGDHLLFLDADVLLAAPTFLADCLREFKERNLDIATAEIAPLSAERVDRLFHWVYNRYARSMARILPHAPGFFILVKRSLHEAIGGFDPSIRYAEDQDYAARAARHGSFGYLRTHRIAVSVRRFDRDGRINVATKNVLAELHIAALGPIRSDLLKYRFGYDEETNR